MAPRARICESQHRGMCHPAARTEAPRPPSSHTCVVYAHPSAGSSDTADPTRAVTQPVAFVTAPVPSLQGLCSACSLRRGQSASACSARRRQGPRLPRLHSARSHAVETESILGDGIGGDPSAGTWGPGRWVPRPQHPVRTHPGSIRPSGQGPNPRFLTPAPRWPTDLRPSPDSATV